MANYNFSRFFSQVNDSINRDLSSFHAPRGNAKTGEIPAWNLVPGVTCSGEACAHCMKEGCYAIKNMIRAGYDMEKNSVMKSWTENTALSKNHPDLLEKELNLYFDSMNAPRFFRIHSAGDFFSVEYAMVWYRVAKNHPGTKFLAFTKQWDVVRAVPFHELDNFSLVLSGWTGVRIPEDLRSLYRCAWCDDGTEDRIPADAIECPGHCDTCGMCWRLKEIGKDTFFHKH